METKKRIKNSVAIIPAAGEPTNQLGTNSNLPNCMVPINGKPIIGYTVEDLFLRGITEIIVVLNPKDVYTEKYLIKKFSHQCILRVLYNTQPTKGLGYSIYLATEHIKKDKKVLIILGDTIYKGELDFSQDLLVTSHEYENTEKWCFIEEKNNRYTFIDKPKEYKKNGTILCGVYFFFSSHRLAEAYHKHVASNSEKIAIEMSDVLSMYTPKTQWELVDAQGWYDCGNIENYYKAKIDFLRLRSFNTISYDDLFGHVTKRSENTGKILEEINWYLNIPKKLRIFMPRLIDCEIQSKNPSYTLEFYGYQTLADSFLFESFDIKIWEKVIHRLFEVISLFQNYTTVIEKKAYTQVYYQKTLERMELLQKKMYWKKLLALSTLKINGKKYKNIKTLLPLIEKKIPELIDPLQMSFLHGDLFLGNILFDATSKLFKFIDPRGNFGGVSIYGDSKYDVAKLRHSFVGNYDFIVSDLFSISTEKEEFSFSIFEEAYHQKIATYFDKQLVEHGYNLEHIKLIEGLLFISMVPLHSDNFKRQQAMYITGIQRLNEVLL